LTMIDNLKKAFSNSIIYSIGNLGTKIIGLILIPIYTRKLTTTDYGMLGVLEVTADMLIAVFSLALYNAFIRLYWDDEYRNRQKEMFFTSLMTVAFVAVLMVLGFYPFLNRISVLLLGSSDYNSLIVLMLVSAGLKIILRIPSTLLRIREKAVLYTIANIARLIVILGVTIYLIIGLGHKVDAIFEAQIVGQCFYLIFLLPYIIKNIKLKFNFRILKGMMDYCLPLIFSSVSGILLTLGDRYCLRYLTTFSEVGIYNLGYKVANVIKVFFISSVQLALPPMIFKMIDQPGSKRFYSKIMTYIAFGIMLLILGVSIYGREIIRVLAKNSSYWDAYIVIPILSMSMLFLMLKHVSTTGLTIKKRTAVLARMVVAVAILNIVLNLLLIPSLGIIGASLATLISRIAHFGIIYYFAQKAYKIPYELKKIIIVIVVGIVLYLLSLLTTDLVLIPRLGIKLILVILFPILLYPLGFYEEIELIRIKQAWQKLRNPGNWFRK